MPGVGEGKTLSYISAHSADVILSDIRPIHLKPDALRAINVLLDEFLFRILSVSSSLATDKLRAALLSLLPTSLGKEALLEAEVELRAYWERTATKGPLEDDTRTFNLQWAFELLRLKCEAYSTLNEQDENPDMERQVNQRLGGAHSNPSKMALLDPAALYLTAIIESLCEHVLSNVGRVAARDGSRANATVNDLFLALCEDDSIFGLFRTMKVYEQIELMASSPKSRRSKSFSRNDHKQSLSQMSTPQNDLTPASSVNGSRSRQSSEEQSTLVNGPPGLPGPRSSMEKTRSLKLFGRASTEKDTENGHKKSESSKTDSSKFSQDEEAPLSFEEVAMLREFDDLMKSASTMKVSLTPDRLRTMEVYKQDKARIRPAGIETPSSNPTTAVQQPIPQKSSVGFVTSIAEDEEEVGNSPDKARTRQPSVGTQVSAPPVRTRSISTSSLLHIRQRSISTKTPPPSAFPQKTSQPETMQTRNRVPPPMANGGGFPPRTRTRGRNRDSLDLDDIMNGSDDDDESISSPPPSSRAPPSSRRTAPRHAVSSGTRELMDFLAEGPPEPKLSQGGRELVDFLSGGPPDYNGSVASFDAPKAKTNRLQRMVSKLSISKAENKSRDTNGYPKVYSNMSPTVTSLHSKASYTNLSGAANRPIPPRPPKVPTPPSPSTLLADEPHRTFPPVQQPSPPPQSTGPRRKPSNPESIGAPRVVPPTSFYPPSHVPQSGAAPAGYSAVPGGTQTARLASQPMHPVSPPQSIPPSTVPSPSGSPSLRDSPFDKPVNRSPLLSGTVPGRTKQPESHPPGPVRTPSIPSITRKPVPSANTIPTPSLGSNDIRAIERLLSNATTADECRLIFDMFLARNGISKDQGPVTQYPSPPPSISRQSSGRLNDGALEGSLVELLLGGSDAPPFSTLDLGQDSARSSPVIPSPVLSASIKAT